MRWFYSENEKPKYGDDRCIIRYAWKPVVCVDGYVRWLEHVKVIQVYVQGVMLDDHWENRSYHEA